MGTDDVDYTASEVTEKEKEREKEPTRSGSPSSLHEEPSVPTTEYQVIKLLLFIFVTTIVEVGRVVAEVVIKHLDACFS
jgi:hypothetical protein